MDSDHLLHEEGIQPLATRKVQGSDLDTASMATAVGSRSSPALAIGAVAFGALAVGALAIGRLAIGYLTIGRSRIRRLEIEELDVKRMRVGELQIGDDPVTWSGHKPRKDERV